MADPSRISLNTATVKGQWSLSQAIEGCARHGYAGISPWRDVLADMGTAAAAKQIRDAGLVVTGLCRGGMFTGTTPQEWTAAIDDNRRAIDEASQIGAQCLVLVVGGIPAASRSLHDAHRQIADALNEILPDARAAGIPLAIEPLHPMYAADRACVNTLRHANELCAQLGDGIGVAVDVYHLWWDPTLAAEIAKSGNRILAFHVCDWLRDTSHMLLDRGMMGDGVIDIPAIRYAVEQAGYQGLTEVEIFSEANWWRRDPDETLSIIKDRVARFV